MSIKIQISFGDIKDYGDWDVFCNITGTNPWCLNEGLADRDTIAYLTVEEVAQCGLLHKITESARRV